MREKDRVRVLYSVLAKQLTHQLRQHDAIALEHDLLGNMTPFGHNPAAADHDVADRILGAGEDGGIEQNVAGLAEQRRLITVDHDEVGAAADGQPTDWPSEGLRAAGNRRAIERRADRRRLVVAGSEDIAAAAQQALAVFEPAQ